MIKSPLVTVIISTYNAQNFILDTLKSVAHQTIRDFEVIVIDDASTDKTVEIIDKFRERHLNFRWYKLSKNTPTSMPRNVGLKRARGKYVAFLGHDDIWLSNHLEKCLALMSDTVGLVHSANQILREDGTLGETVGEPKLVGRCARHYFVYGYGLGSSSFIVRRDVIEQAGLFNPDIKMCQDFDYKLRVLEITRAAYVPEITVLYRRHSQNMSRDKEKVLSHTLWRLPEVYRDLKSQAFAHQSYLRGRYCYGQGFMTVSRFCFIEAMKIKYRRRYFIDYLKTYVPKKLLRKWGKIR